MARRIFATVFILVVFAAAAVSSPATAKSGKGKADAGGMVTYVGCLRVADGGDAFLLTDISGPNAPRGRSWKTGFVTKRAIDMELTAERGVKLRQNVGRLVRVTGRRSGRELTAQSIVWAGATCR